MLIIEIKQIMYSLLEYHGTDYTTCRRCSDHCVCDYVQSSSMQGGSHQLLKIAFMVCYTHVFYVPTSIILWKGELFVTPQEVNDGERNIVAVKECS